MGIENIHIGQLDRRIQINSRVKAKTDIGSETYVTDTLAMVWAKRQSMSSTEEVEDKIVAVNSYDYTIRYHPDIVGQPIQNLYIVDENREFDIYGVEPVGRDQYLILKCVSRE
ncbi:MAG: head-tail adaptor protein [Bacteroidota bacterium]